MALTWLDASLLSSSWRWNWFSLLVYTKILSFQWKNHFFQHQSILSPKALGMKSCFWMELAWEFLIADYALIGSWKSDLKKQIKRILHDLIHFLISSLVSPDFPFLGLNRLISRGWPDSYFYVNWLFQNIVFPQIWDGAGEILGPSLAHFLFSMISDSRYWFLGIFFGGK